MERWMKTTLAMVLGMTCTTTQANEQIRQPVPLSPPVTVAPTASPIKTFPPNRGKGRLDPDKAILPGIGSMPSEKKALTATVLQVSEQRNEIVHVSGAFPNRISTPFPAPKLIDNSEVEWQAQGQSLYISTLSDKPVGLFVTGSGANDPVISLTLIPKSIPAQTLILQLDDAAAASAFMNEKEAWSEADTYTDRRRSLMRSMILGLTPPGFSEAKLPTSIARTDRLVIMPERRLSGQRLDVFTYRVENVSQSEVELSEPSFYGNGVRAISLYPIMRLQPGMSTTVYVISDKTALEQRGAK